MLSPSRAAHLSVRHIRKRFGDVHAVTDASFDARPGEVLGLIGPNGAGKSTLLECIAGLIPADGGELRCDDRLIAPAQRKDVLFYLPDGIVPWADQAAPWALDLATRVFASSMDWRVDLAPALHLDETTGRSIGALSKGQRKRVLLALALLTPQLVTLIDEPFDGLDLRQTREAIALLRAVARSGRTMVVSIHSMRDALRVCDRLALLSDGRVIAEGTADELRSQAGLAATADLEDVFLALA